MLRCRYMNTREMSTTMFQGNPSIGNLFRSMGRLIREWIVARIQAYRYKKLDFHELREDEVTDEMRREAEAVLRIPKKDLQNV